MHSAIGVMQQIGSMHGDRLQQLGHVPVEQQHAEGEGRYAVAFLAGGTDADAPPRSSQRDLRPSQREIDHVAARNADRTDRRYFAPFDTL